MTKCYKSKCGFNYLLLSNEIQNRGFKIEKRRKKIFSIIIRINYYIYVYKLKYLTEIQLEYSREI